ATIHLWNQDEIVGEDNEMNSRFEKLFHHRDHRYLPSRLKRDSLHTLKVMSKSDVNTRRPSNLKTTSSIHDYSETLTSKQQSRRTESKSTDQPLSIISNNETKSPSTHNTASTAAERLRPWVHLPAIDKTETISQTSIKSTSTNRYDPNLHQIYLTATDFSSNYQKSPEYIGEYATITKPEESSSRLNVPDLFSKPSTNSSEQEKNNTNAASDPNITRLRT
ncbi:unnamed protein product, partial [Rotaria sp. Silwood2]